MKTFQSILRIVLPILVIIGAWYGIKKYKAANQEPPSYITKNAERSTLRASVSATGTVSPLVNVTVGAQVSGRILELHADFNDEVTKGQLLARIDPAIYQADVEKAKARLSAVKADVKQATTEANLKKKQIARIQTMVDRKLMAQAELDIAQAELETALAKVEATRASQKEAQATLNQAQSNLDFTYIYSPIDGVILSREVDEGQSLAASFETPAIFQIAEDLTHMQVNTSVAEADIGRIQKGMKARFHVDAWPNRTYEGVVREVRLAAVEESNVVTYDAVIDVPNEDRSLYPGMTSTIDFVIEERENALHIPNAALRFRAPDSLTCDLQPSNDAPAKGAKQEQILWVLQGDTPICKSATLGITNGSQTEIVEGDIHEGDAIIIALDNANDPSQRPKRMF